MKNVIQLKDRLNKKRTKPTHIDSSAAAAPVIDMTEKRNAILSKERRKVRRTILSEFVGAFVLLPRKGLLKVTLYDISEDGLAFDIENHTGHFHLGEQVAMRVYLNQQTYFPFVIEIQNIRGITDEGVYRHGANFVKGTINLDALYHFVKFIETVSPSLQSDDGDLVIPNFAR